MRMKWMVLSLCLAGLVAADEKRAPDTKKVKKAPAFTLPSLDGKKISLKDFENKIVVLEWINYGPAMLKVRPGPSPGPSGRRGRLTTRELWPGSCSIKATSPSSRET